MEKVFIKLNLLGFIGNFFLLFAQHMWLPTYLPLSIYVYIFTSMKLL